MISLCYQRRKRPSARLRPPSALLLIAHQRCEVSSAFFVVAYIAVALPVVGVGILAQLTDLRTAGLLFTALVAILSAAVVGLISWQKTDRPSAHTPGLAAR
jgi:hypothetical protein